MLGQQQLSDRVYMVLAWANTLPQTCRFTPTGRVSKECPVQRRLAGVLRKRAKKKGHAETRYMTAEERRIRKVMQHRDQRRRDAIKQGKTIRDDIRYHDVAHVWAWKQHLKELERAEKLRLRKHDAHVVRYNQTRGDAVRAKWMYDNNIEYNLYHRVKRWMHKHYKGKVEGWADHLPYTMQELKVHLEAQFYDGMTWENRSEWDIDHIKPVCRFHLGVVGDSTFHECFRLENMQPLWREHNQQKRLNNDEHRRF